MIAEAVRTSRRLVPRLPRRTPRLMPSKATAVPSPAPWRGLARRAPAVRAARRVRVDVPLACGGCAVQDTTTRRPPLPQPVRLR